MSKLDEKPMTAQDPLYEQKQHERMEIIWSYQLDLISAAKRVGATVITVESIEKEMMDSQGF